MRLAVSALARFVSGYATERLNGMEVRGVGPEYADHVVVERLASLAEAEWSASQ